MLFLRFILVFAAIIVIVGIAFYLFTRDAKYLRLSWRVFCASIFIALAVFLLVALERIFLIIL